MTALTQSNELTATLSRIRFQNEKGFLIGVFDKGKSRIAALGNLLKPKVGFDYKLRGKWVNNDVYGQQFKFHSYETIKPKSTDGIYRYLVHTAKWIGPIVANNLIEEYGQETINVLKTDPKKIARDIKGLTIKRAKEIQNIILENDAIEAIVVDLEALIGGMGTRKSLPIEIAKKWGGDAIDVLKENPYRLTKFRGIGFLTADKIALARFKIDKKSIHRQKAGILHVLKENELEGNVWCYIDQLFRDAETLLGCDVSEGFEEILKENVTKLSNLIANKVIAYNEKYIADKIKNLMEW